jgi:cell division protein FtsI/penicillin-binding protein 2
VTLTIDRNIQHIAEKELQSAVAKYKARGGMALVLSPKTGEVLAMATAPRSTRTAARRAGLGPEEPSR